MELRGAVQKLMITQDDFAVGCLVCQLAPKKPPSMQGRVIPIMVVIDHDLMHRGLDSFHNALLA